METRQRNYWWPSGELYNVDHLLGPATCLKRWEQYTRPFCAHSIEWSPYKLRLKTHIMTSDEISYRNYVNAKMRKPKATRACMHLDLEKRLAPISLSHGRCNRSTFYHQSRSPSSPGCKPGRWRCVLFICCAERTRLADTTCRFDETDLLTTRSPEWTANPRYRAAFVCDTYQTETSLQKFLSCIVRLWRYTKLAERIEGWNLKRSDKNCSKNDWSTSKTTKRFIVFLDNCANFANNYALCRARRSNLPRYRIDFFVISLIYKDSFRPHKKAKHPFTSLSQACLSRALIETFAWQKRSSRLMSKISLGKCCLFFTSFSLELFAAPSRTQTRNLNKAIKCGSSRTTEQVANARLSPTGPEHSKTCWNTNGTSLFSQIVPKCGLHISCYRWISDHWRK